MQNDITLRPAQIQDLPTLLEFEQRIIGAERPFDVTLKPDPIHYYDLSKLIESTESTVVVALLGDKIIGTGYAKIVPAQPYYLHDRYSYLGFMCVHPDHRGMGINQLIVKELVQWSNAQGIQEVRLEVYADNVPAIKAYVKAGFKANLVEMRLS